MAHQLDETDWIVLRQLYPIALERFSARIIDEIHRITSTSDLTAHDRFTAVRELVEQRRREIANAFGDVRRSNALIRLLAIQSLDLLAVEEIDRFSAELRDRMWLLND